MTASFIFKSYEDNKKKPQKLQKKHKKMLKKFLKHKKVKDIHRFKKNNMENLLKITLIR